VHEGWYLHPDSPIPRPASSVSLSAVVELAAPIACSALPQELQNRILEKASNHAIRHRAVPMLDVAAQRATTELNDLKRTFVRLSNALPRLQQQSLLEMRARRHLEELLLRADPASQG